jgi:hypothetical protein
MGWAGRVLRMGDMKNLNDILVGKREGKRSFGKLCVD